jgi:hypothetical protein
VNGNVVAEGLKLGFIEILPSYDLAAVSNVGNVTQSTIQFSNATTAFVTTANVEVGGEMTVSANVEVGTANLFVDTTTGNVGVGTIEPTESLDIVGNLNLQKVSNTASIKLNSNVVAEYTRSKKLIKYPRVALTSAAMNAYENGYKITYSHQHSTYQAWKAFDNDQSDTVGWYSDLAAGTVYNGTSGAYSGTTQLASETELGEWIGLEVPSPIKLYDVRLVAQSYAVNSNAVDDFVIYAKKQSGDTWTNLGKFTGIAARQGTARGVIVNVISSDYYKFFALVATKRDQQGAYGVSIRVLDFYGTPEYDPEAHGTDVIARSVPNVPNTDWLEVYWDAGNTSSYSGSGSTTVTDLSGNDVTGQIFGTNGFDSTYNAWEFDGSGDYIQGTTSIGTGDVIHTWSLWVKNLTPTSTQYAYICGFGSAGSANMSGFMLRNGDRLEFTAYGTYVYYEDFPSEENTWKHVVGVYRGDAWNSTNCDVYIDGAKVSTIGTSTTALNISGTAINIGSNPGGGQPFVGSIANARLFNRALTDDEVWQLYAYQKEYFGHGNLGMTLKSGRLGIGTTEPRAVLDVRGDILGGCPVYFQAVHDGYFSAAPYNNGSGGVLIRWDTLFEHKGNCFDTSTGLFRAPINGLYRFGYSMRIQSTAYDTYWTYVQKNGIPLNGTSNSIGRVYAQNNNYNTVSQTFILDLSAGDTVGILLAEAIGDDARISNSYSSFHGYYIGTGNGPLASYSY